MKYIIFLLLFPLVVFTQDKPDSDDYEIVNLFVEKYSKPFYYSETDERHNFYLKNVLGNDFNQKCLGTLRSHKMRYKYMDSICKNYSVLKHDNAMKKVDYCLRRDNYKVGLILSEQDIKYFDTHNFANIPKKTLNSVNIKSYAIIITADSAQENTFDMSSVVTLNGPFYNSTRDKAFLEWYSGSSNCILYIKECGVWKEVGNFNYGLG